MKNDARSNDDNLRKVNGVGQVDGVEHILQLVDGRDEGLHGAGR